MHGALPLPSIANYGSFMKFIGAPYTGSLGTLPRRWCIVQASGTNRWRMDGSGSTIWRLSTWRAGKPAAVLYDFLPQSRRHPFYTDVPPSVLLLYNQESNIMASYWNKSYNELPKGFYTADSGLCLDRITTSFRPTRIGGLAALNMSQLIYRKSWTGQKRSRTE